MKEVLEKYIGRECTITGASGSMSGVILSVTDSAVELEIKKKNYRRIDIFNINHIYKFVILDK